jgi:hypothetical protein
MKHGVYRKNKKLLATAKNIFGDIIENAYIVAWDDRGWENPTVFKDLADDSFVKEISLNNYDKIIIKFSTGKDVMFTNSEWASIKNVDMELYENL